ncbi:glycosyltransferase [Pelotomaculum propionicicum]|uniref:Putative mycofactocin biosynthesis glycosyltransferase MftF n=1 Tax=Pelotomaculum propionicicum TaxID=258475 RepID=A0A4Y7RXK1_9FIRM|nr:glycosyltransferase [Pelotomaculum propionicicum]NLI14286.1 glycosyltransferase [Peptococcaceae bacterium]TEB13725.1 putative mycofactocin biosynthesis glycosyltransferase MftF [Pelotomaculum propionicicum]
MLKQDHLRPETSVIIPCKNEGRNLKMTIDSILAASQDAPPGKLEIVVVDDGSDDGCGDFLKETGICGSLRYIPTPGLGVAQARNLGAAAARGEYLIFCDAHITVPAGWLDNLLEPLKQGLFDAVAPAIGALENPAAVGYGQTWDEQLQVAWLPPPRQMQPGAAPLLPGGCVAVRAGAFWEAGGFDHGFIVWGIEDVELSLKMWLFGFRLGVNPSVKVLHLFRKKHPYPVKMDHFLYNMLRMAYSHFNNERVEKVMRLVERNGSSQMINQRVLRGGALQQRSQYLARRKYDDDWFMKKFKINF